MEDEDLTLPDNLKEGTEAYAIVFYALAVAKAIQRVEHAVAIGELAEIRRALAWLE